MVSNIPNIKQNREVSLIFRITPLMEQRQLSVVMGEKVEKLVPGEKLEKLN